MITTYKNITVEGTFSSTTNEISFPIFTGISPSYMEITRVSYLINIPSEVIDENTIYTLTSSLTNEKLLSITSINGLAIDRESHDIFNIYVPLESSHKFRLAGIDGNGIKANTTIYFSMNLKFYNVHNIEQKQIDTRGK